METELRMLDEGPKVKMYPNELKKYQTGKSMS